MVKSKTKTFTENLLYIGMSGMYVVTFDFIYMVYFSIRYASLMVILVPDCYLLTTLYYN